MTATNPQTVPYNPYWAEEMHRSREECDWAFQSTRRAIKALERMSDILSLHRFESLRIARARAAEALADIDQYIDYWVPTEENLAAIRKENEANGIPMPEVENAI